ncbi:unnamed protein product, partial [marine sediment metagenome]
MINMNIKIIAIGIIFIFLLTGASSAVTSSTTINDTNPLEYINKSQYIIENEDELWTPGDEGDHFPCGCEWWWIYATLTLDNGEHWDVALMFNYWMVRTREGYEPGLSFYRVQCWNRESGNCYDLLYEDKEYPNPYFHHSKNK